MCPTDDDYTYQKCVDCGKNFPSKGGDTRCNPCKRELINKPLDVLESLESACRPSFAKTSSHEIDERIADYTQQIDDLEKSWLDSASEIQNFQSAIESLMEKTGNRKKAGDRKTSMEFTDDEWATIYDSLSCASEYHQYKMDSEIKGLRLDLAQKIKGEWVLDAWGYPLFPASNPSVNSSPAKQLQAIEKVLGLVVNHEKRGKTKQRPGLLIFSNY